jgi:flagellar basal-body rod modification protein FlgD
MDSIRETPAKPVGASIHSGRTDAGKKTGSLGEPGKDDFMKLLLAQLQHQDPLKPMEDQAFVAQVATFNQLEELTKLNATLASVLLSTQLNEASTMIGKYISALGAEGEPITGLVSAASVVDGAARIHVGNERIAMNKILGVAADADSLPPLAPPSA